MDAGSLAGSVLPYLAATITAYGRGVVERIRSQAEDSAADETVKLGRQLLGRLLGSARTVQVQEAMIELGEHPDDDSGVDLLRAQVRKALAEDPELQQDIARILAGQRTESTAGRYNVTITGSQGIQIGDSNVQHNTFG